MRSDAVHVHYIYQSASKITAHYNFVSCQGLCSNIFYSICFQYVFDVLVHIPFVAGDDEPRCSHSIWEEARVQQDAICQVGMHAILCSCMAYCSGVWISRTPRGLLHTVLRSILYIYLSRVYVSG